MRKSLQTVAAADSLRHRQLQVLNACKHDISSRTASSYLNNKYSALTCDPAEFDAVYDRCVQAILDVGGQQIVDERRAAYQAGLIRGDFPMEVLSKEHYAPAFP